MQAGAEFLAFGSAALSGCVGLILTSQRTSARCAQVVMAARNPPVAHRPRPVRRNAGMPTLPGATVEDMLARRSFVAVMAGAIVATSSACSPSVKPKEFFDDQKIVELIEAAVEGDRAKAAGLVRNGVDPNTIGHRRHPRQKGLTPLLWTTEYAPAAASVLLLEVGADPLLAPPGHAPAPQYALGADRPGIARALIETRPDLVDTLVPATGESMLHRAILFEQDDMVTFLIEHNAHLDIQDIAGGQTPLHQAGVLNQSRICLQLLRAGADPTIRDRTGEVFLTKLMQWEQRPITEQSRQEHQEVIAELRARGYSTEY